MPMRDAVDGEVREAAKDDAGGPEGWAREYVSGLERRIALAQTNGIGEEVKASTDPAIKRGGASATIQFTKKG